MLETNPTPQYDSGTMYCGYLLYPDSVSSMLHFAKEILTSNEMSLTLMLHAASLLVISVTADRKSVV